MDLGDVATGMEKLRPVGANHAGEYPPRYAVAPGSGWEERRQMKEVVVVVVVVVGGDGGGGEAARVVAGGSPPPESGDGWGGWARNWRHSPSRSAAEKQRPGVEALGVGSCWVAGGRHRRTTAIVRRHLSRREWRARWIHRHIGKVRLSGEVGVMGVLERTDGVEMSLQLSLHTDDCRGVSIAYG